MVTRDYKLNVAQITLIMDALKGYYDRVVYPMRMGENKLSNFPQDEQEEFADTVTNLISKFQHDFENTHDQMRVNYIIRRASALR